MKLTGKLPVERIHMETIDQLAINLEVALAEYNNYIYEHNVDTPILEVYVKHEAVILKLHK